jgi:Xaa-Pro aminopeptidase
MAKDWERGIDYDQLFKERLKRAQNAIRHAGLGAVIAFNFDNIRYITGTHIGEWARDKFMRFALCPAEGPPFLWDPAPTAKRISSPWIADNVAAPISTMQGGAAAILECSGRLRQADQVSAGAFRHREGADWHRPHGATDAARAREGGH